MALRQLTRGLPWVFMGTFGYMLSLAAVNLVLPRYMSPVDFGYWQLFQFYVLYLGYLTFGYSDGLLLRMAGRSWSDLPAPEITSGLALLVVAELAAFGLILAVVPPLLSPESGSYLLVAVLGVLFFVPRVTLTFVFQATGRARDVMTSMVVERLVLLVAFLVFCLDPGLGLPFLIAGDVLGKIVGLGWSLFLARSILAAGFASLTTAWRAFLADCRAGLFVVLSNLTSLSLNGAVRGIIGVALGVAAFGQISLALQVATLLLVVINAVAVAAFPNLRTQPTAEWPRIYAQLSRVLLPAGMATLLVSLPVAELLRRWSPEYTDAVTLLLLLMPVGYFEVKGRGLLSVFLKAVRAEKSLFLVNAVSAAAGALLCAVMAFGLKNLEAAGLSLVVALWLRSVVAEVLVRRRLDLGDRPPFVIELACLGAYYLMVTTSGLVGAGVLALLVLVLTRRLSAAVDRAVRPNPDLEFG